MPNPALFSFVVSKDDRTVTVERTFSATLNFVWDAFTKQEVLDQWWAPKPWNARTKLMNFKEGGRRFYAMVSPEGHESWQIQDYTSISPKTNFKFFSVFADRDENPQLPGSNWDLSFTEQNGMTTVRITIHNESLERMERMIAMGFKEGFKMGLDQLDELLKEH